MAARYPRGEKLLSSRIPLFPRGFPELIYNVNIKLSLKEKYVN